MAAKPSAFDVWLIAVDTVYKGVPFSVVSGWAVQGRLARTDKLRTAGQDGPWTLVAQHPLIAPYLFTPTAQPTSPEAAVPPLDPLEDDDFPRTPHDDDDDVDMIPLIDISLVLLIFFMMTSAVSSMSPVDVPGLKHAGKLSADAWVIQAQRTPNGEILYGLSGAIPTPGGGMDKFEEKNLRSLDALVGKLNARLDPGKGVDVRVAFHKKLQRRDLKEVIRELDKFRAAGRINSYSAEVNEEK